MHPCLQIPELLSQIIESCAPGYRAQTSSLSCSRLGTVSALAQTCRAFHEPALDILWYCQYGLANLLRCLPHDKCEIQESDGMVRGLPKNLFTDLPTLQDRLPKMTEVTAPGAIDWARFDFYAGRVRRLHSPARCYTLRAVGASRTIYMELAVLSSLRAAPLLPNLQAVEYWSPFSAYLDRPDEILKCFAAPSLRSLDMSLDTRGGQEFSSALTDVFTHCGSLRTFHLRTRIGDVDLPLLSSALGHCASLQHFSLRLDSHPSHRASPRLLAQLAALPKLCDLRLYTWIPHAHQGHTTPATSPKPVVFSYLSSFELLTYDVASAVAILERCTFPCLKKIILFSECAAVHTLPSLLKSQICAETLESLSIHAGSRSPTERLYARDPVVHYSELFPLLAFRNLENVSIVVTNRHGLHFDDEGWEAFAHAWPHLRTLRMTGAAVIETKSGCVASTYKSFAHLARLCPDIRSVDIIIADTDAPESVSRDRGIPDLLPINRHVTKLHFHHSQLNDPDFTAAWVAKMFPSVSRTSRTTGSAKLQAHSIKVSFPEERAVASIAW